MSRLQFIHKLTALCRETWRFWKETSDLLFGYDYFIAYRSADGKTYAEAVHRELTGKSNALDCFLDVKNYGAGERLAWMQTQALKNTTRLIVIVTQGSHDLNSIHLPREVREFKELHPEGKVVPIGSSKTLSRADYLVSSLLPLLPLPPQDICVLETDVKLHGGSPSPEVIAKLLNDFSEQRRAVVRQRWLKGTVATLFGLLMIAGFFCWQSYHRGKEVNRRLIEAEIANGLEAVSDDDPFGALPWLGDALSREKDAQRRAMQEFRCAAIVSFCPQLRTVRRLEDGIVAFYSCVGRVCIGNGVAGIRIVNAETGVTIQTVNPPQGTASIWLSSSGKRAVIQSGGILRACVVRSNGTLEPDHVIEAKETMHVRSDGRVTAQFSPDERLVIIGSDDYNASSVIWNLESKQEVRAIYTTQGASHTISVVSPAGDALLNDAGQANGAQVSWPLSKQKQDKYLHTDGVVTAVGFSSDGKLAFAACAEGPVYIWSTEDWNPAAKLAHSVGVRDAVFVGKYLATLDDSGVVRIWDTTMHNVFDGDYNKLVCPAFRLARMPVAMLCSTDEQRLILIDAKGLVTSWSFNSVNIEELKDDDEKLEPQLHSSAVSTNNPIRIVEPGGMVEISRADTEPLRLRVRQALEVCLSKDGRLAATGKNSAVQVWDAQSGQALTPSLPMTKTLYLNALNFSADGKRLIAQSYGDKKARVWSFETEFQNEISHRFELLAQRRVLPSGEIKILSPEEMVALHPGGSTP